MAPDSIIPGRGSRGTPSTGSRPGMHDDERDDRSALPSGLVASNDHLIPPVAQVAMARRAGATWRRVESSHVVMMRRPEAIVRHLLRADARN